MDTEMHNRIASNSNQKLQRSLQLPSHKMNHTKTTQIRLVHSVHYHSQLWPFLINSSSYSFLTSNNILLSSYPFFTIFYRYSYFFGGSGGGALQKQ
jgi:hypothetical protein